MADEFDVLMQKLDRLIAKPPIEDVASEIQDVVAKQVEDSFTGRQTPDGESWLPLKYRSKATGDMEEAALSAAQNGTVTAAGYKSQKLKGPVWKAQNFGSAKQNIPARSFWFSGKATIATVTAIVKRAIMGAFK